eukprot:2651683-Prymnesium_polylepis.1
MPLRRPPAPSAPLPTGGAAGAEGGGGACMEASAAGVCALGQHGIPDLARPAHAQTAARWWPRAEGEAIVGAGPTAG